MSEEAEMLAMLETAASYAEQRLGGLRTLVAILDDGDPARDRVSATVRRSEEALAEIRQDLDEMRLDVFALEAWRGIEEL